MDPALLREVVEEHTEMALKDRVKEREIEESIEGWMEGEEVVTLTGVRRAGKTSIMYRLLQRYGGSYINFEDERLATFSLEDFRRLEALTEGPLFLDEVQQVAGWERFVRRIHRRRKVVVSGSNSALLKGDYASSLTGRTITFTVRPLSFREFLAFRQQRPSTESFEAYLSLGAFPRVALTGRRELLREYMEAILYRDILPRAPNPERVRKLATYLLSNVGKAMTYRSLKGLLGVKHEVTVARYLQLLEEAFLLEVVKKWDPSLKRMEGYEKKVYAVEHGMPALFPRPSEDWGRLLENATLLNLHYAFPEHNVCFSKNGGEVDFLLCRGLKVEYAVNVTYRLTDRNWEREVRPLQRWRERGAKAFLLYLYKDVERDWEGLRPIVEAFSSKMFTGSEEI